MAFSELEFFQTSLEDVPSTGPVWEEAEVPHFYRLYASLLQLERTYVVRSNTESHADEENVDDTDDDGHVDELRLSNGEYYCFYLDPLLIYRNSTSG